MKVYCLKKSLLFAIDTWNKFIQKYPQFSILTNAEKDITSWAHTSSYAALTRGAIHHRLISSGYKEVVENEKGRFAKMHVDFSNYMLSLRMAADGLGYTPVFEEDVESGKVMELFETVDANYLSAKWFEEIYHAIKDDVKKLPERFKITNLSVVPVDADYKIFKYSSGGMLTPSEIKINDKFTPEQKSLYKKVYETFHSILASGINEKIKDVRNNTYLKRLFLVETSEGFSIIKKLKPKFRGYNLGNFENLRASGLSTQHLASNDLSILLEALGIFQDTFDRDFEVTFQTQCRLIFSRLYDITVLPVVEIDESKVFLETLDDYKNLVNSGGVPFVYDKGFILSGLLQPAANSSISYFNDVSTLNFEQKKSRIAKDILVQGFIAEKYLPLLVQRTIKKGHCGAMTPFFPMDNITNVLSLIDVAQIPYKNTLDNSSSDGRERRRLFPTRSQNYSVSITVQRWHFFFLRKDVLCKKCGLGAIYDELNDIYRTKTFESGNCPVCSVANGDDFLEGTFSKDHHNLFIPSDMSADDVVKRYNSYDVGHDYLSLFGYSYRPDFNYVKTLKDTNPLLYLGAEVEVDFVHSSSDDDWADADDRYAEPARQVVEEIPSVIIPHLTKYKNHAYTKHDGSLNRGFEIVTMPASLNAHMDKNMFDYEKAFNVLRRVGFRSHDTDTCGLHVHMSRSFFGKSEFERMKRAAFMMIILENNWANVVRFARRNRGEIEQWASKKNMKKTKNHYKSDEDVVRDFSSEYGIHDDRYVALNLCNRHTFELRIFKGTLIADTYLATLQFVSNLAHYVKSTDDIDVILNTSLQDIFDYKHYKELDDYVSNRIRNSEV
jgi:hypothetical protein